MLVIINRTAALLLGAVALSASAQKFEQVYNIPISTAEKSIGRNPKATLALGPDGKLYGTTAAGGSKGHGTAFRISTTGQIEWLGDFNNDTTGTTPGSPLLSYSGKFYGVTFHGGSSAGNRYGTLYSLDPSNLGSTSEGGLTAIYKTASGGAQSVYSAQDFCVSEPGVFSLLCRDHAGIYRVTQDGSASVLYKFGPSDGGTAQSIIAGGDGYLYGTTLGGKNSNGVVNVGTIFRIRVDGQEFTTLHEFPYNSQAKDQYPEGKAPISRLFAAPDGFLYGTTNDGGNSSNRGNGTIYRIDRNGENFKVIKDLDNSARYPNGELMLAPDGYLYGVAYGEASAGHIYRLKPDGSGFKVMYNFKDAKTDGRYPSGGLTLGADGNLYGVTSREDLSSNTGGSVFRLVTKFAAPPANRPPVAMDDLVAGVSFAGGAKTIAVKANDYDPDGDALLLSVTQQPQFGTLKALPGGALLYTPDADFTTGDSFTYKISDGRSGESEATVTLSGEPVTPLIRTGLYTGLVRQVAEDGSPLEDFPRGLVRVQLAATGKFTGSIQTQGKKITLTGVLNSAGMAAIPIALPDKSKGIVVIALQATDIRSFQAVFYGPQLSTGTAALAVPTGVTTKKLFTAVSITGDPIPVGHGHATANITSAGVVTISGKLGDGTKLAVSTNLTQTPQGQFVIPVFAEAIAKGVWGGDLLPGTGGAYAGAVRWSRPPATKVGLPYQNGIDTVTETTLAPFTPPLANQPILDRAQSHVRLEGGTLSGPASGNFTLTAAKVAVEAPLKSLTLTRTTGAFSGSMTIDKKSVAFTGSLLQSGNEGYGQFTLNGVIGTVIISAPPVQAPPTP